MSLIFYFPILAHYWKFLGLTSLFILFGLTISASIVLIDKLGHIGSEELFCLFKVGCLLIHFYKQAFGCIFDKLFPRAMNPLGLLKHLLMFILLV